MHGKRTGNLSSSSKSSGDENIRRTNDALKNIIKSTAIELQSSSKLSAKTRNFHHFKKNMKKLGLQHGFASNSSTRLILSIPDS